MDNFQGYFMKCNGCTFQNPSFKKDGFKFAPKLVVVADSGSVASGKVKFKVLPHTRRKIWCSFPPMTPQQFRTYAEALKFTDSGQGMSLTIEAFDEMTNQYVTDTYYHNDIEYKPVMLGGQRMVQIEDFELIGH